jgi:O-succinylbenzoic acid--CoA ligase
MPALVALDVPAGPEFVEVLQAVWDAGDAVLPLDPRLAPRATRNLLDSLRPAFVVDKSGERVPLPDPLPVAPGDALVVATSGSTGTPKGVVLTHRALEASAGATSKALRADPRTDTWLACLPLAHVGGLAVVTRALLTGTPLVLHARFDPVAVEAAARNGATLVALVATALRRTRVSGFRQVLLGGSAPPEDLPGNVVATYGMTETGSGVVYDGCPLEGVEIALTPRFADVTVEEGGGNEIREVGEVRVRGPMLLRCYRDGTNPRDRDGWFATGDAGWWEPDGRLRVLGRVAEVIVTGGEKVWPLAVEQALSGHPGVESVAVAGRPDPEWGQRVVAFVVPHDPSTPPTLDELRRVVAERVAPWAAPKELVLQDSLPRLPGGKLDRGSLPGVSHDSWGPGKPAL